MLKFACVYAAIGLGMLLAGSKGWCRCAFVGRG